MHCGVVRSENDTRTAHCAVVRSENDPRKVHCGALRMTIVGVANRIYSKKSLGGSSCCVWIMLHWAELFLQPQLGLHLPRLAPCCTPSDTVRWFLVIIDNHPVTGKRALKDRRWKCSNSSQQAWTKTSPAISMKQTVPYKSLGLKGCCSDCQGGRDGGQHSKLSALELAWAY